MDFLSVGIGIVLFLVCAAASLRFDGTDLAVSPGRAILLGLVFMIYLIGIGPAFGQIDAGNRGVILRGGAVTGEVLGEGIYFLFPPFVTSVEELPVRILAEPATEAAGTYDIQEVTTEVTVAYHLDPLHVATIYQNLKRDYVVTAIKPAVQEAVRATTSDYTAADLLRQREAVKISLLANLRDELDKHHIVVDNVSITNFAFSDLFNQQIENTVVAEERAKQAENDLRRIQIESQQRVAQATGEAEAIRIQAAALEDNPELVELEWVRTWDGKQPTTITIIGGNTADLGLILGPIR